MTEAAEQGVGPYEAGASDGASQVNAQPSPERSIRPSGIDILVNNAGYLGAYAAFEQLHGARSGARDDDDREQPDEASREWRRGRRTGCSGCAPTLARTLTLALLLAVGGVPGALASGWNDYSLEIAPGFTIWRMNSFDVCLGATDGTLLDCPEGWPGHVGPLVGYAVGEAYIATRHTGVKPNRRNPDLPDADPAVEWFFLVQRSTNEVIGPLDKAAFDKDTRRPSSLDWRTPRNPNFWRPLRGMLLFLAMSAVILKWPVAVLISVPTVAGFIWWRSHRRKRAA